MSVSGYRVLLLIAFILPTWIAKYAQAQSAIAPIEISGFRPASDASLSTRALKYILFQVPPGITSITIHRKFIWLDGPAGILDQGIWDPNGFRGWQGGVNRDKDSTITGAAATTDPHYLPGPIPPGPWRIAQSLLKSPPGGVKYQYIIDLKTGGPFAAGIPAIPPYHPGILRIGPAWYAGSLHVHTIHSDGAKTLAEVARMHRDAGYDFFAATDHNTYLQDYEIPAAAAANPGLLILCGEEITTAYGHSNVIGIHPGDFFDFRIDAGDGKYLLLAAKAHAEGAIIEVNHPYAPCLSCYWRFPRSEYANDDGIEVWNGTWSLDDQLSVFAWDRLLKAGKHFRAYGGSDYHRPPDPLTPTTFVYAQNLSRDAIIDGLKRGHVMLSESPHGAMIELSIAGQSALPGDSIAAPADKRLPVQIHVLRGTGMKLEIIWTDGSTELPVATADEHFERSLNIDTDHFYVRAELVHEGKMKALINPIFVDVK